MRYGVIVARVVSLREVRIATLKELAIPSEVRSLSPSQCLFFGLTTPIIEFAARTVFFRTLSEWHVQVRERRAKQRQSLAECFCSHKLGDTYRVREKTVLIFHIDPRTKGVFPRTKILVRIDSRRIH